KRPEVPLLPRGVFSIMIFPNVRRAPLAQLAEQLTLNQRVVGSSPTRGTPFFFLALSDGSRSPFSALRRYRVCTKSSRRTDGQGAPAWGGGPSMPARPSWTSFLRLSRVSSPVKAYTAHATTSELPLHQIHAKCHNRIRYQSVCPVPGVLTKEEIVSGYEVSNGK